MYFLAINTGWALHNVAANHSYRMLHVGELLLRDKIIIS